MELYDAHCHIQQPACSNDIERVIDDARREGVRRMMCCATQENDWAAVKGLAARWPLAVACSLGIHPWYAGGVVEGWEERLESELANEEIAVGETGLDFAIESPARDVQQRVFLAQLRLARRARKPLSIHCRQAFGTLLDILRSEGGAPDGGVMHSYAGSADMVPELARMGFYFSFSGAIANDSNLKGAKSLKAVPPDRLLVETDSPSQSPQGIMRDHNQPSNLIIVARAVARIKGVDIEEIAVTTYRNACALFRATDLPQETHA